MTAIDGSGVAVVAAGSGSSFHGALIDSLNTSPSPASLTNGSFPAISCPNTVYDTDSFVATCPNHVAKGFIIPAGMGGKYDVSVSFYLLGTALSWPWNVSIVADVPNGAGTYIQQVTSWSSILSRYSGMSNSTSQDAAATITAQGLPLVVGDAIVFIAQQHSGGTRAIDYVSFSITKTG